MDGRWRIKEFAERTSVPEANLRAWERRYGLLDPTRSSGGYRLYSAADERRVLAMLAHMARGLAAAQAAALVLGEAAAGAPDLPAHPAGLAAAVLEAVAAYDATRADALIEGAFALGTATAIRDVLMPALAELGQRWERGTISIAQEHFASHLVERRLLSRAESWQDNSGPLALLACPSGERHALGLLAFGVALADRAWRIAYLGADTPIAELHDAAARLSPEIVVLSTIDPALLRKQEGPIRDLAKEHRVLIAGSGASTSLARRLQGAVLAGDPATAAAAL